MRNPLCGVSDIHWIPLYDAWNDAVQHNFRGRSYQQVLKHSANSKTSRYGVSWLSPRLDELTVLLGACEGTYFRYDRDGQKDLRWLGS